MTSLDTRALTVWILEVVGGGLFLGVGAVGVEMFIGVSWIKILAAVLVGLGALYMVLRYRTWTFRIEDDSVYLEHGVFSRVKMVVPLVRIQHVHSRRTPLERATGLSSLVIYTAGSQGSDAKIPGLKPEHAERLQNELKDRTVETEGGGGNRDENEDGDDEDMRVKDAV